VFNNNGSEENRNYYVLSINFNGKEGGKGDTKEARFRNTFDKIKGVLEANGLSLEDVVKAVIYLEDINDRPEILNPLWREYFPDDPPTRTTVEAGLNGGQIEITITAEIPE